MPMNPREQEVVELLGRMGQRINEIADLEARAALVRGWAAEGHLIQEKEQLIRKMDELLDQLIDKPDAASS